MFSNIQSSKMFSIWNFDIKYEAMKLFCDVSSASNTKYLIELYFDNF